MNSSPVGTKKKVLIVDDHPLLRQGLGSVIDQQPDLVVCGEVGTAPAGLFAMAQFRPDVMIVDLSLEEGSGLDLIKDIHRQKPDMPILALSMHREELYGLRAIAAGARGYVMKTEPVQQVLAGLRKLLQGQMAVSDKILSQLVDQRGSNHAPSELAPEKCLSDRELEIFRFYGEGRSTRQIAAKLRIAVSTVFAHRANIKRKLKLATATELISGAARFLSEDSRA
jgi:DNA-binding NarL/FixJ family response regulator